MPWLFNEDAALKKKLEGLTVTDANVTDRKVPVRYRLPESEVADLTFPIIIISHNGWYPATERMHDGYTQVPYAPEGLDPWWFDTGPATTTFLPSESPYYSWFPTPYNFDYQVSVYSRFMHDHIMPLVSSLAAYDRLPARFGFLDIPQDGTKRTMQLIGGPELQTGNDNNQKRIFWVNYIVRVFSELVPAIINPVLAKSINMDFSVYDSTDDITNLSEAKGILSVGSSVAWNVATDTLLE